MTTKRAGQSGFTWWFGQVEDRADPLQIGRLRVRIHNFHTEDNTVLSTDLLQWASVIQPITSAAANSVGTAPLGATLGSTIFGFFADDEHQIPVCLGTLAGIPANNDVTPLARGTNTITINQVGPEPAQAYAAQYPYNKVTVTESGHVFEVDDTPSNERIRNYHKSGTYEEINATGQRVVKVITNNIEVIVANNTVYVGGDASLQVQGNLTANVQGNATLSVQGSMSANVTGNMSANVGGNIGVQAGGTITFQGQQAIFDCPAVFNQGYTLHNTGGGDGSINISGDVKGDGISLSEHKHGGVQSGGAQTSGPIG
jgi:hypothetical protein